MAVRNVPSAARESPDVVIHPAAEEIRDLKHFLDALAGTTRSGLRLHIADYGEWELPASAYKVLVRAVMQLAKGHAVTIMTHSTELTTQSAADLLNISRPHLIRLLDQGAMPSWRVGTHRRIKLEDVLRFREERMKAHERLLATATRMTQRAG